MTGPSLAFESPNYRHGWLRSKSSSSIHLRSQWNRRERQRQLMMSKLSVVHRVGLDICCAVPSYAWLFAAPWIVHARFLCPWKFPGKNTGVYCHFLLQGLFPDPGIEPVSLASPALAVDSPLTLGFVLHFVTQFCPTLCGPMDCSLPGSSVHGESPGRNTAVGCHVLLWEIVPTHWLADSGKRLSSF